MCWLFSLTDGPLLELTLFSSESGGGDMNSTALANMSFSDDERTEEDRESGTEDQADEDREERNNTIVVDKSIRKRKTTSHEEEPLNKVMGMLKDLKEQHEGDKGKNDEEKETLYSITKLLIEQAQKQQQEKEDEEIYTREEAIKFAFEAGVDDAEEEIDHKVRTGLRPFRGDWKKRFLSLGRHAKPRKSDIGLPELGTVSVSPLTVLKLHDRGATLKIAMFISKNQDVQSRSGTIEVDSAKRKAFVENYNWKEPENAQAIAEAVLVFTIALWRIWPEDWSGLVLLKVLTRFKYLQNLPIPKKQQIQMLQSFLNAYFAIRAAAGVDCRPPPVYKEVEHLLIEHLEQNQFYEREARGGKPLYATDREKKEPQNRSEQHRGSSREDEKPSYKKQETVPRRNNRETKTLADMTVKEKLSLICRDFNGNGCSRGGACNFQHKCNVRDGTRVCFGPHTAKDHS